MYVTPVKKTMASPATIYFARLQAAPIAVNPRGAKTSQLTIDDTAIYWTPGELECAFEPKSFDGSDASRVSLCLRPAQAVLSQLDALDTAILNMAHRTPQWFGKDLTPQQIDDRYVSAVTTSASHPPLFRPKINLSGARPCRFWRSGHRVEAPQSWAGALVTPRICLKALWFSQGQFGPLLEVHDAQVQHAQETCPF